jgi:hypothetical protein
MNTKNLLLLFFIASVLVCCKHKDETEPHHDPSTLCQEMEFNEIDTSLIRQFLFKSGTYWIYKDSVSNGIDSCYCYGGITRSETIMFGGGMGVPPCYLHYAYANNSTNLQDSFRYAYYIQAKYIRIVSPFAFGAVALCSNNSGNLTGDSLSLFYPTITINAVKYNNVYKFHFQTSSSKFNEGYFYMKPGLGIVKTELYELYPVRTAHVHELVRYHIE